MTIINMDSVNKTFSGHRVLNNINLKIEEGQIFGLLDPSGAGKTTIIKLLIGLIPLTSGEITVMGKKPSEYDESIYSSFGMVLDSDGLYERLSCYDNLEVYARIYRIRNKKEIIHELLEKVGLSDASNKSVLQLSKGMRQRLAFARSILHSPQILFLDEPTSGLDPATTLQIHSLMEELCNAGTTIFLTTHNMTEAQQMCKCLALLHEGEIIELGSPDEICLKHRLKNEVFVELDNGETFTLDGGNLLNELHEITKEGKEVIRIHSNEPDLEDVFIKLTGRKLG